MTSENMDRMKAIFRSRNGCHTRDCDTLWGFISSLLDRQAWIKPSYAPRHRLARNPRNFREYGCRLMKWSGTAVDPSKSRRSIEETLVQP